MKFYRLYPDTIPPMKAEKSALGNLPTAAFQYCEPIRLASAHGWLVFPPQNIRLKFDGTETLVWDEHQQAWENLTYRYFDEAFWDMWDQTVPDSFKGVRIPFLSPTFASGVLQIWSGLLVETSPGQSTHVRPIANVFNRSAFHVYEGIVHTDVHKPWPLFGNIKLVATDREIQLDRTVPLFQVQPVHQETLMNAGSAGETVDVFQNDAAVDASFLFNPAQWAGLATTVRDADASVPRRVGDYAAKARKRSKDADT